jgi:hypothetical protein
MRRTAFISVLTLALGVTIGILEQQNLNAQTTDPRIADLARTGKLRAGVGVVAPHWAVKNPQTSELQGVAVDVARALARRIGIELVVVEYPSPPAVLNGLKDNTWDVGFLAIDPSRAAVVDFSPPYLQIDATYLVPDGSSIGRVTDADQSGVRIAVTSKSVEQIVLSRLLKQAELRTVDTIPAGSSFYAQKMPMYWRLRALHCFCWLHGSPALACSRTDSMLRSERWQFRKARRLGLPTLPSLSRRPKPRVWSSKQSTPPVSAESRSQPLEIRARSSEPSATSLSCLLMMMGRWHYYRDSGLVQCSFCDI